jgi:photosystem II stability/assembly factor-like uncharacterized protein
MPKGFLAVGHNGVRLFSPDGLSWTVAGMGREGEVFRAAAFGNGRFVTVGSFGGKNIYAATSDGTTWTTGRKEANYSKYLRSLFYVGDRFLSIGGDPVTVGAANPFVCTTADGEAWSDYKDISGKFLLRRVAAGNGILVSVGDRGRRAVSKDGGTTWDDVPNTRPKDTMVDIAFGNGVFIGVGLHGLRMTTRDGLTWSEPLSGEEGEHINSILFAGGRFVGVGLGGTYLSKDGDQWERRPNQNAPLTATFGNNRFVGAAWRGRLLTSEDGIVWRQVYKSEYHLEAVTFGG